jgi:hypothetical protein
MPLFRFGDRIVLFVHIPKTAGTSIEKMLSAAGGIEAMRYGAQIPSLPCTPQHFHAEIITRLFPPAFYDAAFTIVRNPYARIASEYKMRVLAAGRNLGFDDWVARVFERYQRNMYVSDNHIRPQSEFLIEPLTIFRFEQLPMTAVRHWLAAIGIDLPTEIVWERRGEERQIVISRATAARIAGFYAADFEQFAYSIDDFGPSLVLGDSD